MSLPSRHEPEFFEDYKQNQFVFYEQFSLFIFEIIDATVPTSSETNFLLFNVETLSFFIFLINLRLYLLDNKFLNMQYIYKFYLYLSKINYNV